ncbi:TetR/AcrR family transcriptional regulator [Mumia sp. ZJ430]|uniref:TetR/AcrR family transcriptional regulator n=1 Tax=Mumia sp. ZJ430 TaxID=2708083 RepID=UPI00141F8D23|nr:TetR/AcrR family transcriptional regulator [Mumia sp. ZJ430]
MPSPRRQINRGPAAAGENRAAILAAARRVFAEQGYHAPLYKIAKEAGVGQGVLYRHFPNRLALGFAVFEENFVELREVSSRDDAGALEELWARLLDLTITDAAFVEMFVDARRATADYDGAERLVALLEPALDRARAAGRVDPELTTADLLLAHRMVFGVVATAEDEAAARVAVAAATALIPRLPPAPRA